MCNSQSCQFGVYTVTTMSIANNDTHTLRSISVQHTISGERRTIHHIQYNDWCQGATPKNVNSFIGMRILLYTMKYSCHVLVFLDAVASIRRQLNEERQQAITSIQNVTRNSRSSNSVSIYANNIVL
jgi:hypothetical protein